jgi:hypothetical protein
MGMHNIDRSTTQQLLHTADRRHRETASIQQFNCATGRKDPLGQG